MQAATPAPARSTGSTRILDLGGLAAEAYCGETAARRTVHRARRDVTYAKVGQRVPPIAVGLVDLGVRRGKRVCRRSTTRGEWTCCDFAIASAGGSDTLHREAG